MDPEDNPPNLIMMVGLPGSGKTTIIQKLLTDFADREYVVLSPDEILLEMGRPEGLDYNQSVKKFAFRKAEDIFAKQFKRALAAGENIIVDRTNLTVGIRAKLLRNVPADYTKTAVICEVDPEELKRRLDGRTKQTGKIISKKVLTEMIASYQPPARPEFDDIKRVRFAGK